MDLRDDEDGLIVLSLGAVRFSSRSWMWLVYIGNSLVSINRISIEQSKYPGKGVQRYCNKHVIDGAIIAS